MSFTTEHYYQLCVKFRCLRVAIDCKKCVYTRCDWYINDLYIILLIALVIINLVSLWETLVGSRDCVN
jgi:hypothetical protein